MKPISSKEMDAGRRQNSSVWLALVLLFLGFSVSGQENILARRITISFTDLSPAQALDRIAFIGKVRFSYDASLFENGKKVSVTVKDMQLSRILDRLFKGEVACRQLGDYVILSKAAPRKSKPEKPEPNKVITGHSSKDTLTRIGPKSATGIKTEEDTTLQAGLPQKIDDLGLVRLIVPENSRAGSQNTGLYRHRTIQVSVIPVVGTNGKNSGLFSNSLSLNLLAGYSRDIKGVELGGLINIERLDVRGFQLAGISNMNGGNMKGLQVSAAANISLGAVHGMQMTAGVNRLTDSLKGVQLAGLCNLISGKMKGLQFSGIANLSRSHVDGCQVATIVNKGSRENNGAQVCGLVNYSKENWGFQLAGIMNFAKKDNRGAQVAGIFNYTKRLNGFQLALINYSEHVDNGIPVGFLSIIRHDGFYQGEISADEVFYGNIAFRAGVPRFYNIYRTGTGNSGMVNFSWGFGTLLPLKKIVSMCFDLTSGIVMTTGGGLKYHGLLTKLAPTIDFRILKHFSLFAGPSVNLYWYYTGNSSRPGGIAPYTIYQKVFTTGPHGIEVWIGGVVGVKI